MWCEAFLSVLDQTTIGDMARADAAGRRRERKAQGGAKGSKIAKARKARASVKRSALAG